MKKQAFNPYLPGWEYIADGEPRVFGERIYIFGSHDRFDGKEYCENDYVAWSAPVDDLGDWRYEGVTLKKEDTPWNQSAGCYYAPDVVLGPDGRYYMYYFVANTCITSVAVCETPAGRYQYLGDVHRSDGTVYGAKKDDWFAMDPSVLVDTGGRIFLYTGSGQISNKKYGHKVVGCFVMELEPDMLTIKSEPALLLPEDWSMKRPGFFEGASARHIGDYYYLVYPTSDMTGLNYAISRKPDGGFVHKGRIHCTSDVGLHDRKIGDAVYPIGNYHGGLVQIKEQWYIFDHRQTNGKVCNRQGVAEPVTISEEGSIAMVESTSCGLNGGPLDGKGTYPANICCALQGKKFLGIRNPMAGPKVTQSGTDYNPVDVNVVDGIVRSDLKTEEKQLVNEATEKNRAPYSYIANIEKGAQIGYKYFDLSETSHISLLVRHGSGRIELTDGLDGNAIASVIIPPSDDWILIEADFDPEKIVKASSSYSLTKCPLYFRYEGKGRMEFREFVLS